MLMPGRGCAAGGQNVEILGIPLLDHAEAAELALDAVVVTVVVGVAGHEVVAADVVVRLHPLDDVDREGDAGDPGLSLLLVFQVELRGWGILHLRLGPQVVLDRDQEVRLLPAHQVDEADRPARLGWQGG